MALTQLKTSGIADDAVTTDKLANAINTERTANTAKSTNATHTGEVTGSGALTITDDTVDEANLKISNAGSNGQFLQKQSGNNGGLTWATPTDTNTVTTINNNADNKIITGSGTANTLEGEALAQIDSDGDLWIGHAPTTHYDNRKMFIHQPTAGETAYLSITGEQGAGIVFGDSVGQNTGNYESLIWHNNSDDSLKITTDNGDKGIKIENGGDVEVINGNVKFASGHGIDFSATANASGTGISMDNELFKDYEEGSWTPVLKKYSSGSWVNATMTTAGSISDCYYVKIGDICHFHVGWDGFEVSDSSYCVLGGLPFASAGRGQMVVTYTIAFSNTQNQGGHISAGGDQQIQFYYNGNNWNSWRNNVGGLYIYGDGWYKVA